MVAAHLILPILFKYWILVGNLIIYLCQGSRKPHWSGDLDFVGLMPRVVSGPLF